MKVLSLVGLSLLSTLAGATKEDCNETLSEGRVLSNFYDATNDDVTEAYDNEDFWEYPAPQHNSGYNKTEPVTCDAGQRQCYGHYGPGGDGNELLDKGLKWCCDSCNCKDLGDATTILNSGYNKTEPVTCDAGQRQCYGHYGPGGDGNELLDKGLKWCCDSCNCKDLGDATTILNSGYNKTTSPTMGPSLICTDKHWRKFTIQKGEVQQIKPCTWLNTLSEYEREDICLDSEVYDKCPSTCNGACPCRDKKYMKFLLKNQKAKFCMWLSRLKKRNLKVICRLNNQAMKKCPDTCAGWCRF